MRYYGIRILPYIVTSLTKLWMLSRAQCTIFQKEMPPEFFGIDLQIYISNLYYLVMKKRQLEFFFYAKFWNQINCLIFREVWFNDPHGDHWGPRIIFRILDSHGKKSEISENYIIKQVIFHYKWSMFKKFKFSIKWLWIKLVSEEWS